MEDPTRSTGRDQRPEAAECDDNDITLPNRIISSRTPHSGVPALPPGSWFKKHEQSGVRQTPDFTEIGEPDSRSA